MDPITYPSITINGKLAEVKYRQVDIIWLWKTYGLDLFDLKNLKPLTAEMLDRSMKMLLAGVRHALPDLTLDQLFEQFTLADQGDIEAAMTESIKKASTQAWTTWPKKPVEQPAQPAD